MNDRRSSVPRGIGPIVLRVDNQYGFYEHPNELLAEQEAERLAIIHGGEFVVYVPVTRVKIPPRVIKTEIPRMAKTSALCSPCRGSGRIG